MLMNRGRLFKSTQEDNDNMLKTLEKNQWYWRLYQPFARYRHSKCFNKFPGEIIVELTNACNLRCPSCPTNTTMVGVREKGYMELDLFKSLIDEFDIFFQKPKIFMNFAGEPLLHELVDSFVAYAHSKGHWVHISTNVTRLSGDLSRKLINSGLSHIYMCIDGSTKEAHEAFRVGSDFEVVKKNIETFLKLRKELGSNKPYVEIQTILTSFSEYQVDDIRKWAYKCGADAIFFRSMILDVGAGRQKENEALLPTQSKYTRNPSNIRKTVCMNPLNHAVVFWDGFLGLCCADYNGVPKGFNVKGQRLIETFTSPSFIGERKRGFLRRYALCKDCFVLDQTYRGERFDFKVGKKETVR